MDGSELKTSLGRMVESSAEAASNAYREGHRQGYLSGLRLASIFTVTSYTTDEVHGRIERELQKLEGGEA